MVLKMTLEEALEISRDRDIHQIIDTEDCSTSESTEQFFSLAENALEKQVPYKLVNPTSNSGICKCGKLIAIGNGINYCRYCGQRLG